MNWVYISSVIRMCVCVWCCTEGEGALSGFLGESVRLFWRFYLLLLDRLTQEGVESPLDFSVRLGYSSED